MWETIALVKGCSQELFRSDQRSMVATASGNKTAARKLQGSSIYAKANFTSERLGRGERKATIPNTVDTYPFSTSSMHCQIQAWNNLKEDIFQHASQRS